MPLKSEIKPFREGRLWRVIVPKRLAGGAGRRVRRFRDRASASAFCSKLMDQDAALASGFFRLNRVGQGILLHALRAAGDAQSVLDAVRFWREQRPEEIATLKELAIRCVAAKEKRAKGGESKYTKTLRATLTRLIIGKEDMLAHSVQPQHIADWINADPLWSQDTRQTYLRDLTTMFSYGVANGMLKANPCSKVDRPAPDEKPPFIWSPLDAKRFMRSAERIDPAIVQFLALCLFGGLRCDYKSEAWNVQREDIRDREIAVQGKKVRSRNRRFVTINPTLRAWLSKYPGDFSPVNMRRRLDKIRAATAIGENGPCRPIEWNHNPMRHSFVSYYCELHGVEATTLQSGHDKETLVSRYRERVTRDDAERFWGILPL